MKKGSNEKTAGQGALVLCESRARVGAAISKVEDGLQEFFLSAGMLALKELFDEDVRECCGLPRERGADRQGYRWGETRGSFAYAGQRLEIERPRVRAKLGDGEIALPTWRWLAGGQLLNRSAFELMILGLSSRKYRRAIEALDLGKGETLQAVSRSAVSRRFVAASAAKFRQWIGADLGKLDLLAIQIDGLRIKDRVLVAAVGIDAHGYKHPLAILEGATENAATVKALLDDLIERKLDPKRVYLFIIDGAKALKKAIREHFGADTPIQRCQVHKARNIIERLPERLHRSVRIALKQAWEQEDAARGAQMIGNLARRLEQEAPGVSKTIIEGSDEMLTVSRLELPAELKRSLACTNIIENAHGTVRTTMRNVKRWRNAKMMLRWVAAGFLEAHKTFRRLKAYRQLYALKRALLAIEQQRALRGKLAA